MKLNSPFLYVLFLGLFFSCTSNNSSNKKENSAETAINSCLDKLSTDTVLTNKKQYAEKAIQIATQNNNTPLLYKSVLYKLDYIIIGTYPDSIPFYLDRLLQIASKTEKAAALRAYVLTRKAEYAYDVKDYQKNL